MKTSTSCSGCAASSNCNPVNDAAASVATRADNLHRRSDLTIAAQRSPSSLQIEPWGAGPFAYEQVVQPVWDAQCVSCHNAADPRNFNLSGTLDTDLVPASYRTLIAGGWVHYFDWGYAVRHYKAEPASFGTLKSKLWQVLDAGHYDVKLTREQTQRIKCWIDLNCPLWPDYVFRPARQLQHTILQQSSSTNVSATGDRR